MPNSTTFARANTAGEGNDLALAGDLLRELFPICRSITGPGVRQTLGILNEVVPFDVHEVPTGTVCYDWTVPDEWAARDAYVADDQGRRVIDFQRNNVHLMSYSEPVDRTISFAELDPHLVTLPSLPDAIPYRTSYYRRAWGFGISHNQYQALDRNAQYRVKIDTTLAPGSLTYGDRVLPGTSGREYLISTYCCHPSLANDNLSSQIVWALLLRALTGRALRNSYRFVIIPETIGSVVYLSRNEAAMKACAGGFVLSTVGGPGPLGFKHTFQGDGYIDQVALRALKDLGESFVEYPFSVMGSDERSYSGPAFRIPVGTICKDKYYEYPEYHTSLDNLDLVRPEALITSLRAYLATIDILERDRTFVSLAPPGEPQLGRRGLYPGAGGSATPKHGRAVQNQTTAEQVGAMLSVLFWADGKTSLMSIANRNEFSFASLAHAADLLESAELIRATGP